MTTYPLYFYTFTMLYCNNVTINEACTRMDKGIKYFHAASLSAQEVGI